MKKKSLNKKIYNYILKNYKLNTPIIIKDIYKVFLDMNKNTVRSIFSRLEDKELLIKIENGIYALPNTMSILGKPAVYISDVIEKKYIRGEDCIIGYRTGINFANKLGLTTQTASVDSIISNAVSKKKREIKINNNRLIVNAPRIEVNNNNYKLLQVLDLLNDFNLFSEIDLKNAKTKILDYIANIIITEDELENIVSIYPLEAQVKFYKIGGQYAITQG